MITIRASSRGSARAGSGGGLFGAAWRRRARLQEVQAGREGDQVGENCKIREHRIQARRQGQIRSRARAGGGTPTLLDSSASGAPYGHNNGRTSVMRSPSRPRRRRSRRTAARSGLYFPVSSRRAENVATRFSNRDRLSVQAQLRAAVTSVEQIRHVYASRRGLDQERREEARMVEAMRKGADMVVAGESGKGTSRRIAIRLKGLGQALDRVAQEVR